MTEMTPTTEPPYPKFSAEPTRRTTLIEHTRASDRYTTLPDYGQNSFVGKILESHQELPGRIHIMLIRQSIGF